MGGHTLHLFDSMTREIRAFVPLTPGKVGIYSCGPTVYHYAHLGNLRAYVFTDTLRRVLLWKGYHVHQVMNITDVGHLTSDADEGEDKMEKAAASQKRTVWDIAKYYTDAFSADLAHLNILPPDDQPKATDNIAQMIAFNRKLEANGHTYLLDDGLYFDTATVPDYGKLGRLDIEGLRAGARVAETHGKRNPTDFCLWRKSPTDAKRAMEWDSPWGVGAPGWHLECSQMSIDYLGAPFDIHTGGIDHRQVHHCNEVAQNQGYLGKTAYGSGGVGYWMHNEFLVQGADKMSKSRGDFLRLQSVMDHGIHPLVYRYFCLQASYRKPLEFNWDALKGARQGLKRLLLRIVDVGYEAQHGLYQRHSKLRRTDLPETEEPIYPTTPQGWIKWLDKIESKCSQPADAFAMVSPFVDISEPHCDDPENPGNKGTLPLLIFCEVCRWAAGDGSLRPIKALLSAMEKPQEGYKLDTLLEAIPDHRKHWVQESDGGRLDRAISNDLNTPRAIAALYELMEDAPSAKEKLWMVAIYDLVLGLKLLEINSDDLNIDPMDTPLTRDAIQALMDERLEARKAKNFARADAIRDELDGHGILIKDGPQGTTWEWKPTQ